MKRRLSLGCSRESLWTFFRPRTVEAIQRCSRTNRAETEPIIYTKTTNWASFIHSLLRQSFDIFLLIYPDVCVKWADLDRSLIVDHKIDPRVHPIEQRA